MTAARSNRRKVRATVGPVTEDGERLAWHAYGRVARQQLDEAAPVAGDLIAIRYEGKREATTGAFAGRGYHAWRVVVERAP